MKILVIFIGTLFFMNTFSSCSYETKQYHELAKMSKKMKKHHDEQNFLAHQAKEVVKQNVKNSDYNAKAARKKQLDESKYMKQLNEKNKYHKGKITKANHTLSFY